MLHKAKTITWLSLIDLTWYLIITAIFFTAFYPPILNVLDQAFSAINENTASLTATQDPSTTQIAIWPFAQALIKMIVLFIAISAIIGYIVEVFKTRISYKKWNWGTTALLQVGQTAFVIILLSLTQYILYLNFAYPLAPAWFVALILILLWALFFWFCAHAKAKSYNKVKFNWGDYWQPLIIVASIYLLLNSKLIELVILSFLVWLIAWNTYQYRIATFK